MLKLFQFMSAILFAAVVLPAAGRLAVADDADPARPDATGLFDDLDTNGDGSLAEDEVPDEHRRLFKRLVRTADADDNGSLSAEEFASGISGDRDRPDRPRGPRGPDRARGPRDRERPPREGDRPPREPDRPQRERPSPERIFKHLDENGDGKVTIDEVPEERRERFQHLMERGDKDGDEALSLEEFTRAMPRGRPRGDADGRPPRGPEGRERGRPGRPGRPGEGRPAGRPGGPPEGRPEGRPDPRRFFEHLDADGDGRVTLDEVPEQARPRLERMMQRVDKNGDGAITMEEFAAMRRGRPGRPGEGRPEQGFRSERPGEPRKPRSPGAGRRPPGDRRGPPPALLRALDADRDGQLSAEEIQAASEALLKLDRDGDGSVTAQELGAPRRDRKKRE